MGTMFSACTSAEIIDISSFDNSASKGNSYMLARCDSLKTLILGEKFSGITADMRLRNGGWANKKAPDVTVSGSGEFAVIANSGKNTYIFTGKAAAAAVGDSNGDGAVNTADLVTLSSFILGKKSTSVISRETSDMNGDGAVDIFDVVELRKLLIKGDKN